MKHLMFKPGAMTNYGDALNDYLWPKLLPELETYGPGLFVGIGTHLDDKLPKIKPMIVFGAGAGYGHPPDLSEADVRFVRGPKSAEVLGVGDRHITDPGILIALLHKANPVRHRVSFIPRWTQILTDPTIPARLAAIGIRTIDPTWTVEHVTAEIASSELVVTEALHGAVVADALRIPWIACVADHGHLFKWLDWTQSMGLEYDPVDLGVCSVPWAIEHGLKQVGNKFVFAERLLDVQRELRKLRKDLGN